LFALKFKKKTKEKKRKNHFQRTTTIHTSFKEEKDAKMDPMMQEKH
jgi:hypothetical protein